MDENKLVVDFTEHQEVLKRIKAIASKYLRTSEMQVLAFCKEKVKVQKAPRKKPELKVVKAEAKK